MYQPSKHGKEVTCPFGGITHMTREIFRRLIIPAAVAAAMAFFFQPVYHPAGGEPDYILMLLLIGIPFGIQRMFVWCIPRGQDLCGTVGLIAFNVLVGGVIGIFVLTWRVLTGFGLLALGAARITRKITRHEGGVNQ